MNPLQTDQIPQPLAKALASGQLAVVAGAGISMLAPSNLPSWWGFNQALLAAIKRTASRLLPPSHDALLDVLSLERGIPVVAFSDHVVRTFAGNAYFPLLRVLESSRTNANHRALAELARQKRVRHIVTPNFDSLIERAFREAGVDLEVLVGRDSPGAMTGRGHAWTWLHKIHGSVGDASSMVDTVAQKLRGLSAEQRAALERVFADCHVLFIGFSGADFEFDPDYLPLRRALEAGQSFTWVSRRGSPAPEVARRLARSPDWLVEGELPQWFNALGLDPLVLRSDSDAATTAGGMAPSLEQRIDEWIVSPGFGPWPCAALCLRLLNHLRLRDTVGALERQLGIAFDAALQDPGGLDVGVGAALRQLCSSAMGRGDFALARAWSIREWQFLDALHGLTASRQSVSESAMREYWRNTAGVCINLAVSWRHDRGAPGRREGLTAAMKEATTRAHRAQDPGLLAALYLGHGQDSDFPFASRLQHLRTAQAFAAQVGDLQALTESLHLQAELSLTLSELAQAQIALDESRERLNLLTGVALRWNQLRLEACLSAHKGDSAQALARFTSMLDLAGEDVPMLRETARNLLAYLSWHADLEGSASALWDRLLTAIGRQDAVAARALPPTWSAVHASSGGQPAFLPRMSSTLDGWDEDSLRGTLAWAEFTRDDTRCLTCMEALCQMEHRRGRDRAWRLRDLARALRLRAQSVGHVVTEMVAGNYIGIASELSGDLQAAAEAWQAALSTGPDGHSALRAAIQANLARILAQTGDVTGAQAMFESARAMLRAQEAWSNYYTATVNQARMWGQEAQLDKAVALVTEAASLAETLSQAQMASTLRQLAAEFASGRASADTRIRKITPVMTWQQQSAAHRTAGTPEANAAPVSPEQLATDAMARWDAGDEAAGRRMNLEARQLYEDRNDLAGASRCWHNLSSMQWKAGEQEVAIESMRQALELRMLTDDHQGQIRVYAGLSAQLNAVQQFEAALELTGCGLVLAETAKGAPGDVVQLHQSGLRASLVLRRWAEARLRLRSFEQFLQGIDHPQLREIEDELSKAKALLDQVERACAPVTAEVGVEVSNCVQKARAAAEAGDQRVAIAILKAALRAPCDPPRTAIDRGTLHGELANLLTSVDTAGALAHYDSSAVAYDEAGSTGMAWHARGLAAVHKVNIGQAPAESLLAFAQDCPEVTPALNVLTACGNALIALAHQDKDERGQWESLRNSLAALIEAGQSDAETLGRACLQWAQACLVCEDKVTARHAVELARKHLTRSNSRYLDQLYRWEEALAEDEKAGGTAGT
jgi:tetratricopeptide (TPR) repeat protein